MASKGQAALMVGGGFVVFGALAAFGRRASASTFDYGGYSGLPNAKSHPDDIESLARVIASEAGGEPEAIQIAVAYASMNAASKLKTSLTALVKYPDGKYGPQTRGISVKDPKTGKTKWKQAYCASGKDPLPRHRTLAAKVYNRKVSDPTRGAVQYDSPQAQRKLLAMKKPGYKKTPEDVAAARRKAGKTLVLLPGVPEDRFRMWA